VSSSATEPAPLGYKDGNPPTYYNVTTTAGFSGSIEVCIDYSAISFDNEQYLKLFQYLDGTWIDITSCVDTENDMVCGSTYNLSILAIFEPSLASEALVDIDPDTLDLGSKGDWVTCYIELADGYKVMDINGETIRLGGIPAHIGEQGWARARANSSNIMDHDGDGVKERMVKFDRSEVQAYLTALGQLDYVELMVSGGLIDGPWFEGVDVIRVVDEGQKE
jgi:hypothetical protein